MSKLLLCNSSTLKNMSGMVMEGISNRGKFGLNSHSHGKSMFSIFKEIESFQVQGLFFSKFGFELRHCRISISIWFWFWFLHYCLGRFNLNV